MTLTFAISAFSLFANLNAQNPNPSSDLTVAIQDANNFCLIISPLRNDIAASEKAAKSACYGNPAGGSSGFAMPSGLITSAHVVRTSHYIQVSGGINAAAGGYSPSDAGTQFDDSLLSQGGVLPNSGCAGKGMYLEYFSASVYCVRCCNDAFSSYCDPTKDTQGCSGGIPGNTGPGFSDTQGTAPPPIPVVNYHGCAPKVDSCSGAGFVCCVSKGDSSSGLTTKTTCQYKDDCVPGTIGSIPAVQGSTPGRGVNATTSTFTASFTTSSASATESATATVNSTATNTSSAPTSTTTQSSAWVSNNMAMILSLGLVAITASLF